LKYIFSADGLQLISSIGAAVSIGAIFLVGVGAAVFVANKFKKPVEEKDDNWKEIDEENFKDVAKSNPIFEEEMKRGTNPMYVSSRESTELSYN